MKRVLIHALLPGMVLVKPVTNANGLPIITVGTTLDAAMIERLQGMELASVYVERDAGDSDGKTLMELEAELDHRFRLVIQDPIQQLILKSLRAHFHATRGAAPTTEDPAAPGPSSTRPTCATGSRSSTTFPRFLISCNGLLP